MRTMILVELDTPTSNQQIADGSMDKTMQAAMANLNPEAAYFTARNGKRTAMLVVDVADPSAMVTTLEPFWAMNATVEMLPCMNADDLRTGLSRLPH